MIRENPMRIAVLLIAGVLAFGPAAHAADAPLDNAAAEAPPAAASQEAPAPVSAAPGQEGGGPPPGTLPVPIPAPALAPPSGAPPVPAPAPEAAPVREPSRPPAAPPPGAGAPAAPGPSMAPVAHSPTYLSIDFTDVELPVLIKFMSEQTKRNFIFDERVQGKITIISPRRVTLEEAYDVFLSVLQAKGFTTVTQGNTIKIVAAREARQDTIRTGVSKETPSAEFITRLVPLVNLESAEVVPLITPLVSKDGMVSAFGSSNTLLLIDSRANIDRIVTILAEVDGPGSLGVLRVYPLDFAVATDAAKTLTSIYLEGGPPAPGGRRRRGRPRGADPRLPRHRGEDSGGCPHQQRDRVRRAGDAGRRGGTAEKDRRPRFRRHRKDQRLLPGKRGRRRGVQGARLPLEGAHRRRSRPRRRLRARGPPRCRRPEEPSSPPSSRAG